MRLNFPAFLLAVLLPLPSPAQAQPSINVKTNTLIADAARQAVREAPVSTEAERDRLRRQAASVLIQFTRDWLGQNLGARERAAQSFRNLMLDPLFVDEFLLTLLIGDATGSAGPAVEIPPEQLAGTLEDIGIALLDSDRDAQVERAFSRMLAIRKTQRDEDPLGYSLSLNQLAAFYFSLGRHKEALPLCEEALIVDRRVLGDAHPDVATDLSNLAALRQQLGDYGAAKALYRRAIDAWKVAVGPAHPDLASALADYAGLLRMTGETEEADVLEARARQIFSIL